MLAAKPGSRLELKTETKTKATRESVGSKAEMYRPRQRSRPQKQVQTTGTKPSTRPRLDEGTIQVERIRPTTPSQGQSSI